MSVEKEINDIDDLIGKVLAGEASAEEQVQLNNWIRESELNKNYFEQIRLIFDKAAANQVQLQFDADVAWRNVRKKIQKDKETKRFWISDAGHWGVLRIAAGVILVLTAGIVFYRWSNQPLQTFAVVSDKTTVQDTLPDGSTAFLNKNTSLAFEYSPQTKTRKVKLQGEGFFEVKHEEEKPFIIEAEEVLVKDIGTAFNVKAYPGSDTVEVMVQSGEVQIYTIKNPGLKIIAGETGIYSKRLREFSRIARADTNVLAYKTGVFSFNNTDLRSMIEKLNEVYGSNIRLGNEKIARCRMTVNFSNEKLDSVVDIIAETFTLTVTRRGKEILLEGAGCE